MSFIDEYQFRVSAIYINDTGVNSDAHLLRSSIMHQCSSLGEETRVDIGAYALSYPVLPYPPQARAKISNSILIFPSESGWEIRFPYSQFNLLKDTKPA